MLNAIISTDKIIANVSSTDKIANISSTDKIIANIKSCS